MTMPEGYTLWRVARELRLCEAWQPNGPMPPTWFGDYEIGAYLLLPDAQWTEALVSGGWVEPPESTTPKKARKD